MNFLQDLTQNLNHSAASAHEKGDEVIGLLRGIADQLADMFEAVTAETDQDEYFPLTFPVVTDGAGTGVVLVQRKPGFVSELVSISAANGLASMGVLVYIHDESPLNLVYAGTGSVFFSDQFPEGSIVPDGANMLVRIVAGPLTSQVNVTIRSRRKMLDKVRTRNVNLYGRSAS